MKQREQLQYSSSEGAEFTQKAASDVASLHAHGADSDLLRDTLALHIGLVVRLLLRQTFADAGTVSRYFAWLDALSEDTDEDEGQYELARAGLGPDGALKLVARPRADEFMGHLTHPEFSAVASLAYSVAEHDIIGIHLVGFDGKPMLATRWLQGLRRALERHTNGANTPSLIN